MNKYEMALVWKLADKGCELAGWHPAFLGLDAQLCAALYYLNELIDSVGEHTPTGRRWARWEGKIEQYRREMAARSEEFVL